MAADQQEKRAFNSNARRLWHSATAISDSPAEGYLALRGILRASDQLRYLERTPLGPRGAVQFLPAMLAAVTTDMGIIAIHRTFLDAPSAKLAAFDRPKRALGSLGCGAVRLAGWALPKVSKAPFRPCRCLASLAGQRLVTSGSASSRFQRMCANSTCSSTMIPQANSQISVRERLILHRAV